MTDDLSLQYIGCPYCRSAVAVSGYVLVCRGCRREYEISGGVPKLVTDLSQEESLSAAKWERLYHEKLDAGSYHREYDAYMDTYFRDTFEQLNSKKEINDILYLEIGCGPFFMGQSIADRCRLVIGVDFCLDAIAIAKSMMYGKGITNYLLIQEDVRHLPIRGDSIDLIYGGG